MNKQSLLREEAQDPEKMAAGCRIVIKYKESVSLKAIAGAMTELQSLCELTKEEWMEDPNGSVEQYIRIRKVSEGSMEWFFSPKVAKAFFHLTFIIKDFRDYFKRHKGKSVKELTPDFLFRLTCHAYGFFSCLFSDENVTDVAMIDDVTNESADINSIIFTAQLYAFLGIGTDINDNDTEL